MQYLERGSAKVLLLHEGGRVKEREKIEISKSALPDLWWAEVGNVHTFPTFQIKQAYPFTGFIKLSKSWLNKCDFAKNVKED